MEWLQTIFNRFTEAFKWWFILQPWEQALRVRGGKKIVKFEGGLHFKVPYIDFIFKQNVRLRLSDVPSQTITTLDGKTITLSGALWYRVGDVTPLFNKLHTAEEAISGKTQAIISSYVAWSEFKDCSPEKLMEHVNSRLELEQYGLEETKYILRDFAVVRTYRFITGDMSTYNSFALQTNEAEE